MHGPLREIDLLPNGALRRIGHQVRLLDTVDSTNALLLGRAAELGDGAVVHAEFQSAGRGRLGRRWVAPRGSSIMLSVLLIEPAGSPLLEVGALLGTLAACEAVDQTTDCRPAVRWPNDLVLAGCKLGGVLAEVATLNERRALVIGVGINCLQQRGHFAGELSDKATSLECASESAIQRAPIAAALLRRLDAWLHVGAARSDGWHCLRTAWRDRCADLGMRVTLEQDTRTYTGTVLDIADAGDLVVELDQGGRRHFAAATTTRVW